MSDEHRCSAAQILVAFLAGAAVGAAVALLTTPRTGKENREKVSDWMKRAGEEARGAAPGVRDAVSKAVQAAGEAIDNAFGTKAS